MPRADTRTYLRELVVELSRQWPDNRTVTIVCHGHSVPAGYFATPFVDTFNAYPHLLHRLLKDRFPYAVVNVIVTAIGGEGSRQGADRFAGDVLTHRPDVVLIDYGLNDRDLGPAGAEAAWREMIEAALAAGSKVILLTPTHDVAAIERGERWEQLCAHAEQIRRLADDYGVGLADSFQKFADHAANGGDPTDLLSWTNHPNRSGHELVAAALVRWFSYQ